MSVPIAALAGLRIVVVDDDRQVLDLIQTMLRKAGYHVTPFTRIDMAYAAVRDSPPHLVITDLGFHGRAGGLDLLALMQQEPETRTLPVILCSAAADLEALPQGHGLDRVAVLSKPFAMHDLLTLVRQQLERAPPV